MTGEIAIRVRYAETDRMGLLHHANYLVYFEQARIELLREAGVSYRDLEDQGFLLVLTKVEVAYRRPARYDDVLTIKTSIARSTMVRIDHRYEVVRDGELIAEGATTLACVDRDGRPQALPEFLQNQREEDRPAVRIYLIRNVLPWAFCLLPVLAAALIAVALPTEARDFYLRHLTGLDWFILALGTVLFLIQTVLARVALRWETTSFHESYDKSLSSLGQSAEWFPLLGLIGTVAGIMQTFASFGGSEVVTQAEIISKYAPAITATMSGLFMALLNILPTWIVSIGRQIILKLGGEATAPPPAKPGEAQYPTVTGPQTQADRL